MYSSICALCEPIDCIVVEPIKIYHIAPHEKSAARITYDSFNAAFCFWTHGEMCFGDEAVCDRELLIFGIPPYGAAGSRVHAGLEVIDEYFACYAAKILKGAAMTIEPC